MLKNKEERRKFLEDPSSWNVIYDLKDIGLRFSEIKFKNNLSLIKEELYVYSFTEKKGKYILNGYRILDRTNFTTSLNLLFTSAILEFLKNNSLIDEDVK